MKKILDVQCYHCKEKYNAQELYDLGYIDVIDNFYSIECPKCGEPTYIKDGHGYKGHKIYLVENKEG